MIQRIGTTARWSDVVIHHGVLYVVEVPNDSLNQGIDAQIIEVLQRLTSCLTLHGSGTDCILQATIYLKNMQHLDKFNMHWDAWLPLGTAPVRACVQAQLAHADYGLEIQLTAAVPE